MIHQKEFTEGNRIIFEFLHGPEYRNHLGEHKAAYIWYHERYDLLEVAVDRIISLGYHIQTFDNNIIIEQPDSRIICMYANYENRKEARYRAVVSFCKWFKEFKQINQHETTNSTDRDAQG